MRRKLAGEILNLDFLFLVPGQSSQNQMNGAVNVQGLGWYQGDTFTVPRECQGQLQYPYWVNQCFLRCFSIKADTSSCFPKSSTIGRCFLASIKHAIPFALCYGLKHSGLEAFVHAVTTPWKP